MALVMVHVTAPVTVRVMASALVWAWLCVDDDGCGGAASDDDGA